MPRTARIVVPGIPHHVIQRGNRSEVVFFKEEDRRLYLKILAHFAKKYGVEIWKLLSDDQTIFIWLPCPSRPESLAKMMAAVHKRYTVMINIRNNWKGTLWQGRYLPTPWMKYIYTPASDTSKGIQSGQKSSEAPKIIPGQAPEPTSLKGLIRFFPAFSCLTRSRIGEPICRKKRAKKTSKKSEKIKVLDALLGVNNFINKSKH